jgi:hypothetical protein
MTDNEFTRTAALVVVTQTLSVEEISSLVGCQPDRSRSKGDVRPGAVVPIPAKETSWELCERAGQSVPLSDLLERLSERILPLRDPFLGLVDAGCTFKLALVQWISEDDPHGPGFALNAELLGFLAEVQAVLDVDQYVS